MQERDRYFSDPLEGRGLWHLPSVLMTAAAVGLIVLVNAGVSPSAGAAANEAERSVAPAARGIEVRDKPDARAVAAKPRPATPARGA